jgi:hypothetical protein
VSAQHAQQYYFGQGTETAQGSGTIDTYAAVGSLTDPAVPIPVPQPGLNAPIAQDKQRGSS